MSSKKSWSQWFEIPVTDFGRAQQFYETVFDTKLEVNDFGPIKMGVFPHTDVGCAICKNEEFYKPSPNGPVIYMDASPDLQVALNKVESAGGKVVMDKKQISPDHGFMAVFIDSEGNRLALHSME